MKNSQKCQKSWLCNVAGPHYKVHCTEHNLRVDLVKHEDVSDVYLQHLKDYPGKEKLYSCSLWWTDLTPYDRFHLKIVIMIMTMMIRSSLQAWDRWQPSHLQPWPGQHLPVHAHQGRRQEHGEDDDCHQIEDHVDYKQGRRVFYHRVVMEYGEKAAKDVSADETTMFFSLTKDNFHISIQRCVQLDIW